MGTRQIEGRCHCGNIAITLAWPESGTTIPARACGCDFCRKHSAVWTSRSDAPFSLSVKDTGKAMAYRFGTGTADFHICKTCGVTPIATCEMEGRRYAVVNVNVFEKISRNDLSESPTDFEGETIDDRLARRKRNWSPEA